MGVGGGYFLSHSVVYISNNDINSISSSESDVGGDNDCVSSLIDTGLPAIGGGLSLNLLSLLELRDSDECSRRLLSIFRCL